MRSTNPVSYKTVVVSNNAGSPVGAGIISTVASFDAARESSSTATPTSQPTPQPTLMPTTIPFHARAKSAESTRPRAAVATLASFGGSSFAGTIVIQDTLSGIEVFGTITGADASNGGLGKLYVGNGYSCTSSSLAGTAYYAQSSNPWASVKYAPPPSPPPRK